MVRTSAAALAVCLALTLQACDSDSGDGGGEAAPVTLTSTSPAMGETRVATTAPVTLTFSGALDASTVASARLPLRCPDPYGPDLVPADVAWDAASRTVTLTPLVPLATKRECWVEADGLRDAAGHEVAASVAFRTLANPPIQSGAGPATVYAADEMGNVIRRARHFHAGADGEWLTGDDAVEEAWTWEYDLAGNWTRASLLDGPGDDGAWFTADDRVWSYELADYDDALRFVGSTRYRPGLDGLTGTADDVVIAWSERVYTAAGDVERETTFNGPGPDATWFTADDAVAWYFRFAYDAVTGRLVRAEELYEEGPDGAWFTEDDSGEYVAYEYGAEPTGLLLTTLWVSDPGDDLAWYTADDPVRNYEQVEHVMGLPTWFTTFGRGADGVGRTDDDVIQAVRERTYAENGGLVAETEYNPGPDGEFFTGDDVAGQVTAFDATL